MPDTHTKVPWFDVLDEGIENYFGDDGLSRKYHLLLKPIPRKPWKQPVNTFQKPKFQKECATIFQAMARWCWQWQWPRSPTGGRCWPRSLRWCCSPSEMMRGSGWKGIQLHPTAKSWIQFKKNIQKAMSIHPVLSHGDHKWFGKICLWSFNGESQRTHIFTATVVDLNDLTWGDQPPNFDML